MSLTCTQMWEVGWHLRSEGKQIAREAVKLHFKTAIELDAEWLSSHGFGIDEHEKEVARRIRKLRNGWTFHQARAHKFVRLHPHSDAIILILPGRTIEFHFPRYPRHNTGPGFYRSRKKTSGEPIRPLPRRGVRDFSWPAHSRGGDSCQWQAFLLQSFDSISAAQRP